LIFWLCDSPCHLIHAQRSSHALVKIQINDAEEGDSIRVVQNSFNIRTPETRIPTWLLIHNKQIKVEFNEMKHPGYLNLYDRKHKNLMSNEYLVEPGDSVTVVVNGQNISYVGRGCQKWQCVRKMELALENIAAHHYKSASKFSLNETYDFQDSALTERLRILNTYSNKISEQAFHIMQADLFGSDLIFRIEISGFDLYTTADASQRKSVDSIYRRLNMHMKKTGVLDRKPITTYSYYWPFAILKKYLVDSFIMRSKSFDLPTQCRYIISHYGGTLRDHLMVSLLHNFHHASPNLVSCLRDAMGVVGDTELGSILEKQYQHYLQGTKAFNFSLVDTAGRVVRLSDFANKTIVMDYWYTGCFNCIEASTALKSIEPIFNRDTNFVFLSICVDPAKSTWLQSLRRWIYSTPDRINLFTNQRGMEDPLIKYYDIFGYPTLMMIDKKGNLSSARLPDPRTNKGEPLIKAIRDAMALK